ncbi:DUF2157 domain-containing protein [Peribacillus psychrosaccharolyticus]|uniref:DUF2157 domain-containing protein n=1 Tax=Peribacillus psychrosaccharolyticus TaxID=1407 RepID=UPI003D29023D
MNKRQITKKQYDFLEHELKYLKKEQFIEEKESDRILSIYQVKNVPFITVLAAIGALLIGLGVLTFVASNWMYLTKPVKLVIIILLLILVNTAGVFVSKEFPKTARSLHYIGILVFGAGIFLIEQMFNISINFNNSFLLWAIGTIIIGWYLKDTAVLLFTTILLFIYINGSMFLDEKSYPLAILLFSPSLYVLLRGFSYPVTLTFFINALSINTFVLFLLEFVPKLSPDHSATIISGILFIMGIFLIYIPLPLRAERVTRIQGHILHGITAIILTFDFGLWFSLFYFIFLLYLIQKGSLTSIVIICALIFRYYLNSLEFLPTSFTFINGGIILLGFGFFFEKQRKKGGETIEK